MSHVNPHAELLYTWYTLSPLRCKATSKNPSRLSHCFSRKRVVTKVVETQNLLYTTTFCDDISNLSRLFHVPCLANGICCLLGLGWEEHLGKVQSSKAARQARSYQAQTPIASENLCQSLWKNHLKYTRDGVFICNKYTWAHEKKTCMKLS